MSADTSLIKTPHKDEQYTRDELFELVNCANDPKYFITNYCYIQHPTKGRMRFELFDYQYDLVDSYHENRYSISMLARQMGKSTCAAAYLLWYAMFIPDSTILIAAHKFSGAQEIMSRIRFMYESCPDFIRAGATAYNKGSLEFDNGSRIIAQATTESTGRGLSISLVYLDEFAFVRPRIAQEFWTSLSPTLATGGKCIITSTPNQDNDQFAQIWQSANKNLDEYGNTTELGANGFASLLVTWERHPDRDELWATQEKNKIGEDRFAREHECRFIAADETLINGMKLATLHGIEPVETTAAVRWYSKPMDGETFVLSLDPSLGTGGDNAAVEVYALPNMRQIAEWKHNKTDVRGQLRVVQGLCALLTSKCPSSSVYWSLENNTIGEAALVVLQEMGTDAFDAHFVTEPKRMRGNRTKRKGFTTTNSSKLSACEKLKYLVESDKFKPLSKPLVQELKTFIARGASYAAKDGETDDLVSSTLLALRIIQAISSYELNAIQTLEDESFKHDEAIDPMPVSFF